MHICIAGAGASGLAAALELTSAGCRVTILETQDRVGGRALTLTDNLADGLVAQAGPSRFPSDFSRVFAYSRRFDLDLMPYYPSKGTFVSYLKGKRNPDYPAGSEEFWGYTALVNRDPGVVERAILTMGIGLRKIVRRLLGRPEWASFGIRTGTNSLTDAIARACNADILLGATVESVQHDDEKVGIVYRTRDGVETMTCDYAIVAVPLSVLHRIDIKPQISDKKLELMKKIPFSSAVRVFLQMRRPYWKDAGHNGFAVSDTVGEVWDPHIDKVTGPSLLVCYAVAELADELGAMDEEERICFAVDSLESIFPGATENFVSGTSICWREQPWIEGGWPLARAEFSKQVKEFRRSEGRLFFAGDYTCEPDWLNTLEGALQSGESAAGEIRQVCGLK